MFTPKNWMLTCWVRSGAGFRLGVMAASLVCASVTNLLAAPKWNVLETPRFTVVSQSSERQTREWADQFNQFMDAMKSLFRTDDRLLAPLTIVIFEREKDFAAYRPLSPDGKPMEWVCGHFGRRDTWSVIGMIDNWEEESMRRRIYQDGAFWILSADNRQQPLWLTYGVAQVFSTFRIEGQKAKWGDVIEPNVRLLRTNRLIPMEQFLFTSRSDKAFTGREGPDLFYAQSWLFVHYLLFGQRKDSQGTLSDFITAMNSGGSMAEAFQKTFGLDYAAMEEALDRYLNSGRFNIYEQSLSATGKITESLTAAKPRQLQVALGKLALSTARTDLARKHAEEAVRLDPDFAPGRQLAAWVQLDGGDHDGALASAEKAVQLGANDADAFFLCALTKAKKARSLGGIPPLEARQISDLYEKAIHISPALKAAYMNLANVLVNLDELNEQDELFVARGVRLFPDEPAMQVGRANMLRKKGNKDDALKILEAICADPGRLSPEQMKSYTTLKIMWDVSDTQARAGALLKQKNPKEALVLLDGLLQRNPPPEARAQITRMRWDALAASTLQDARAAAAGGRSAEAARLFQTVADMERAPARLRGIARSALQKLNGSATPPPGAAASPAEAGAEK